MRRIAVFVLIVSSVMLLGNGGIDSSAVDTAVDAAVDAAVDIAKNEAKRRGYKTDEMLVTTGYSGKKYKYFNDARELSHFPELFKKLESRTYWVVSFYYFPPRPGGNITVYIDAVDRSVIGVQMSV